MPKRQWVPLDLNFDMDPKILKVQPLARLLYVYGLALSKRLESDGALCRRQVNRLLDATLDGHRPQSDLAAILDDDLVKAGLWEKTSADGDIQIVKWLEWNDSAAEIEEKRDRMRDIGARGGSARSKALSEDGSRVAKLEKSNARLASIEADFERTWSIYPKKKGKKAALKSYIAARRKGATADDLHRATETYAEQRAGKDPDFTKWGQGFFGSTDYWKDYLDIQDDETAVEKPDEGIRLCSACNSPTWVRGVGPVSCDCPADGEA